MGQLRVPLHGQCVRRCCTWVRDVCTGHGDDQRDHPGPWSIAGTITGSDICHKGLDLGIKITTMDGSSMTDPDMVGMKN